MRAVGYSAAMSTEPISVMRRGPRRTLALAFAIVGLATVLFALAFAAILLPESYPPPPHWSWFAGPAMAGLVLMAVAWVELRRGRVGLYLTRQAGVPGLHIGKGGSLGRLDRPVDIDRSVNVTPLPGPPGIQNQLVEVRLDFYDKSGVLQLILSEQHPKQETAPNWPPIGTPYGSPVLGAWASFDLNAMETVADHFDLESATSTSPATP